MPNTKKVLTFDTETIGVSEKLIYDIGWVVSDKHGEIVSRNFAVKEIITDADLMMGAFFGKKVYSHYIPSLACGNIELAKWNDIVEVLNYDIEQENVAQIQAYNLAFDIGALHDTQFFVNRYTKKILQHPINFLDLWLLVCTQVCNTKLYHDWAEKNGLVSEAGNVRTTAEAVYRYLFCVEFTESHTALHDAIIENEIFWRVKTRKQKIPFNVLESMPWRIAQEV